MDNISERQGEVARANLVLVGVGCPPSVDDGWEGVASLEGLGARGQLRRPVRRRGRARWQTRSDFPSMTESNVEAATVGNVKFDDECPTPLVLRTAPKYKDVGQGEGVNKAGGSGSTATSANACAVNAAARAATSW